MEGGVRVTEESIINGIPIYTYEDYISSTTPYEYAYQYIDDSFTLERVITQMSNNAKEEMCIRDRFYCVYIWLTYIIFPIAYCRISGI